MEVTHHWGIPMIWSAHLFWGPAFGGNPLWGHPKQHADLGGHSCGDPRRYPLSGFSLLLEDPPLGGTRLLQHPPLGLTHLWASASPRGPSSRNSRMDRGSSGSAALRSTRSPPGAFSSPSRGLSPAAPRNRTSRSAGRIPCGTGARHPAGGDPGQRIALGSGWIPTPGDPTRAQRSRVAPPTPQGRDARNPPSSRECRPDPAPPRSLRTFPSPRFRSAQSEGFP